MKHSTTLYNAQQGHEVLTKLYAWAKPRLIAGQRLVVSIEEEKRSTEQNNTMWSCLTDISKQVEWHGKRMTAEAWKDFLTAHLQGQELVPNMDGNGFVVIGKGKSTSKMSKAELGAVIDLCHAFGASKDVVWSPTSIPDDQKPTE